MAGYSAEEGWHTLPDAHKIYTKAWIPNGPPLAVLLFIHGFSDHINSHYDFFPSLALQSIETHAFDQRGWGRSVHKASERGLTGPTSTVLDDITSLLQALIPVAEEKGVPLFLMGHSMGGAEILVAYVDFDPILADADKNLCSITLALRTTLAAHIARILLFSSVSCSYTNEKLRVEYAVRGPAQVKTRIRGYLAESPYLALHTSSQPSRFTVTAGRLASKVAPNRQMVQKLDSKSLSRDPTVCNDWANDELCHDTGTLEGLAGMLDRGDQLNRDVVVLDDIQGEGGVTRIWIGHGDEDRITSYIASKQWFERSAVKDKEFKTYVGWYHKLHAEPGEDKITFANDVAKWILARLDTDATGAKSKL